MLRHIYAPGTTTTMTNNIARNYSSLLQPLTKNSSERNYKQQAIVFRAIQEMDIGLLPPKGMYDAATPCGLIDTGEGNYEFSSRHVEIDRDLHGDDDGCGISIFNLMMNFNRYLAGVLKFDPSKQQIRIYVDDPDMEFRTERMIREAVNWMQRHSSQFRMFTPTQLEAAFGSSVVGVHTYKPPSTSYLSSTTRYIMQQLINSEYNLHFAGHYADAVAKAATISNKLLRNEDYFLENALCDYNDRTRLSLEQITSNTPNAGYQGSYNSADAAMRYYGNTEGVSLLTTNERLFNDPVPCYAPLSNLARHRNSVIGNTPTMLLVYDHMGFMTTSAMATRAQELSVLRDPLVAHMFEEIVQLRLDLRASQQPMMRAIHKTANEFIKIGDIWELCPLTAEKYGDLPTFNLTGGLVLPSFVTTMLAAAKFI